MTLSDETKQNLKATGEMYGKTKEQLMADFKEIYENPAIVDREDREELAVQMLKAHYASTFQRPTQEYDIFVIDTQRPRTIPKKDGGTTLVGNIFAMTVNPLEEPDPKTKKKKIRFAKIAHFNEQAPKIETVKKGEFYHARLSHREGGNFLNLSATNITSYEQLEEKLEGYEDVNEVLRKVFKVREIAELQMLIGKEDMILIEGQVNSARIVPRREQEGSTGIYTVVDASIVDDKELLEEMRGGLTVFVDEAQVTCGYLSKVLVLGRPRLNEDTGQITMNGELVIPVIHTPFIRPQEDVSPEDTGLTEANKTDSLLDDEDLS